MGTTTPRDLIKKALFEINVLASGEATNADDESDAFDLLNMMLETWGNKRNRILSSVKESFSLVIGQSSYTIGTGGDFNTERPVHIEQAFIRSATSDTDYPVEILEDRAIYEGIPNKSLSARPFQLYFERIYDTARGNILFNREPSAVETIFLVMWKPFSTFSTLTDTIVLPPGYKRAIYTSLAVELAPSFGKSISAELASKVSDANSALDSVNLEIPEMDSDAPARARGGRYNINSDRYW